MRFSALATTAVAALVTYAVEAKFEQIGVPKIIKAGEPFTAEVRLLAAQPSHDYMYWGVRKFDYEWNSFPSPGTVGNKFQKTDLNEVLRGSYYDSIPGITIPRAPSLARRDAGVVWRGVGAGARDVVVERDDWGRHERGAGVGFRQGGELEELRAVLMTGEGIWFKSCASPEVVASGEGGDLGSVNGNETR
ncbi:hypothetical protein ColLi_07187 [Colletotrichum liriopes]|uniref:Uncharacterized protein n=1 Tax=Colletotrichum liriopes TaxID=708192 RepID=A0AA37GPA3_9PEZI|nr:hypothetical protein ColLi_07187 [Colletotrichum liriopes]